MTFEFGELVVVALLLLLCLLQVRSYIFFSVLEYAR